MLAIHLLTEYSIEERVWETLRLKKELFKGLFDGAGSEISFEKLGRRSMIETLKQMVPESDLPGAAPEKQMTDGSSQGLDRRKVAAPVPSNGADGTAHALTMLLEAGIKFLETLAPVSVSAPGESKPSQNADDRTHSGGFPLGQIARNIEAALAPLIKKGARDGSSRAPYSATGVVEPRTNRPDNHRGAIAANGGINIFACTESGREKAAITDGSDFRSPRAFTCYGAHRSR